MSQLRKIMKQYTLYALHTNNFNDRDSPTVCIVIWQMNFSKFVLIWMSCVKSFSLVLIVRSIAQNRSDASVANLLSFDRTKILQGLC